MKVTFSVLFSVAYLAISLGLPAPSTKTTSDELEFVPLERHNPYGDQPIIDTGVIGYDKTFSYPFSGFLGSIGGIMERMRQQIESLLERLNRGNSSEEIGSLPFGGLTPIGFDNIDLGKGNTTSTVKIVDGHSVVINDTTYNDGAESYFVRVIDVKPIDTGLNPGGTGLTTNKNAEEITLPPPKDRESVEDSVENEIPKSREARNFANIETFDEMDSIQPFQKLFSTNRDTEWNDVMPLEPFEDNSINFGEPIPPIDLSGDIRVNQIMADAGAPINPDAEFIYDIREPRVKQLAKFNNPR